MCIVIDKDKKTTCHTK